MDERLHGQPGVRILTSFDPALSCGIGAVSLEGAAPEELVRHLWDKRRIIVTPVVHREFQCLRVTATTTPAEVDVFAEEMKRVVAMGLPG